jgi:hypothetical protein
MTMRHAALGIATLAVLVGACGGDREPAVQLPNALSVTPLGSPHTYDDLPGVHRFSASCALRDLGTERDYLLVLGGLNASGAETRDWFLLDPSQPSGQSPSRQVFARGGFGSARDARAFAKAYSLFDANHYPVACVLVGGLNSAGSPLTTFRFEYDSTRGTAMQVTNAGTLTSARGAFELLPCGAGRLIAIGGATMVSGTPPKPSAETSSIEIWNGSSSWIPASSSLALGRFFFGAAKDAGQDRYVVAGGVTAGAPSASIESISVGNGCDPAQVTTNHDSVSLPAAVAGNVVLFHAAASSTVSTFYSAGGQEAGSATATANVHQIDLDWTMFGNTAIDAGKPQALPDAVAVPTVARTGDLETSPYLLVGGIDKWDYTDSATSLRAVNKFTPGSGWAPHAALANDRAGAAVAFLPSRSKAYTTGGLAVSNGTLGTDPVTTGEIVP